MVKQSGNQNRIKYAKWMKKPKRQTKDEGYCLDVRLSRRSSGRQGQSLVLKATRHVACCSSGGTSRRQRGGWTCTGYQLGNFIASKKLANRFETRSQMHSHTKGTFKIKMKLTMLRMDAWTTRCGGPKSAGGLMETTR